MNLLQNDSNQTPDPGRDRGLPAVRAEPAGPAKPCSTPRWRRTGRARLRRLPRENRGFAVTVLEGRYSAEEGRTPG